MQINYNITKDSTVSFVNLIFGKLEIIMKKQIIR